MHFELLKASTYYYTYENAPQGTAILTNNAVWRDSIGASDKEEGDGHDLFQ
jgi:hypothetical protein